MGGAAAIPVDESAIVRPIAPAATAVWPTWQRVLFRFFSVYLLLQIGPWNWFFAVPGVPFLLRLIERPISAAVYWSNAHVFHVRDKLVPVNGSGDTSYAWTELWLYLAVALIVCVVWSLLD